MIMTIFLYLLLAAAVASALFAGYIFLRGPGSAEAVMAALFPPRPERRLDVVEQASIDGKRRLILIRRDGVEHLIMTGGPVDVVIETGIGADAPAPVREPIETAAYNRPARTFGGATPARTVTAGSGE